ncbi:MAG: helix-turn-helix domain-containing protein, partial [Smithellaceae bacterium]|nr:helix-turn-helix domain-containing protein [Smithellaceae bacterium]
DNLPATRPALLSIRGMGEKKVKKYGAEILIMTANFRRENNMETPPEEPSPPKPQGREKGESQKNSFELFLAGKSVQDIATERNMAASTIEGHLSHFVGTGQLPVEKLVPAEKIARIADYFSQTDNTWAGAAKTALGDDVSYGEINCVLKHLQYLKGREG